MLRMHLRPREDKENVAKKMRLSKIETQRSKEDHALESDQGSSLFITISASLRIDDRFNYGNIKIEGYLDRRFRLLLRFLSYVDVNVVFRNSVPGA